MEKMFDYEFMRLEKEGKLARLTFTRENQLNAMNNAAVDQIDRIASTLRDDPNVRVVIIRGAGRAFCTGIDLKELAAERIEMDYHH
jgi:enoyl-CoA hydratase/carnithine racemase